MANINVIVQDANNIQLNLTPSPSTTLISQGGNNVILELTPTPTQVIAIDRGVAGNGIESVTAIDIDGSQYLHIVFTNGTTSDVGPISTSTYFGVSPIVVTGDQISLSTVPVSKGGTGAITESGARTNLGLGTMATENSNSVSISGGTITGITDLAIADGGTGASTASGARTNLGVTATGQDTTYLYRANNLSDLSSASTARTNLGLGSAAVLDAGVANGVATLDSGGTVPLSQIPASIQGGLNYQGTWNASTNTPTLTSSIGSKGYYYTVSVAGSTNLNGITDWNIGDLAVFNGSIWEKIDNTDAVTSVNGYTGAVTLGYSDVGAANAGTNTNITSMTGITGGLATADFLQLDTAITPSVGVAKLQWDTTWGGPQIGMEGGNVNLQIGQETLIKVYNNTGSSLNDGQVVYVTGSQGQRLTVGLAQANSDSTSATIIGMVTEPIANNASGFVTTQGMVNGLNTSGESDGAVVYLSPTTAGAWTTTKPVAPQHLVMVGYIVKGGSAGAGSIYINTQNGYELEELHNVLITSPTSGNTLIYDASVGVWKNANISAGTGISVTNGAGSISIANNGVTSISGGSTGLTPSSDTSGSVTLAGTLALTNGGTGATSASTARTNLGVTATGQDTTYLYRANNLSDLSSASTARTNLGATTIGSNLYTLTNPSAITFPRFNADNTISALDASSFRTAIGAGTSSTTGTVTSVGGTGTVSGITLSGTVTSSGNLTLGGTLSVAQSNLGSNVAGNGPVFAAGLTSAAIVSSNTSTILGMTTEYTDTNSNYSTTGSGYFQPSVAGYYQINAWAFGCGGSTGTNLAELSIYKNGSAANLPSNLIYNAGATYSSATPTLSTWIYLNGTGDYIQLAGRLIGGGTLQFNASVTVWQGFLARAA